MSATSRCDVAIVGGSIAGCITALCYANHGLRVVVLERAREATAYKALCTHFIQPIALPALQHLGLDAALEGIGAVRTRASFWTPAGWIDPPGFYGDDGAPSHAYNIERRLLDPFLRSRAQQHSNVTFQMGHRVTSIERADEWWTLTAQGDDGPLRVQSRLVVAADGRHSLLAGLVGNDARSDANDRGAVFGYFEGVAPPPDNRSLFMLTEPERGFLYPLGNQRALLALYPTATVARSWLSSPVAAVEIIRNYFSAFDGLPDCGSARLTSRLIGYTDYPNLTRSPVHAGVAFVGDAALSLDPLSGVGCGFAIASSYELVTATWPALVDQTALAAPLAQYATAFEQTFLPHATGIKADSRIAKTSAGTNTYRHIASNPALQRAFVDLTGRLISPLRFQQAYMASMIDTTRRARAAT